MKKIIAIVITLVLCLSCVVSASAATNTYIHNPDGILTSSEADELSNYARMIYVQPFHTSGAYPTVACLPFLTMGVFITC